MKHTMIFIGTFAMIGVLVLSLLAIAPAKAANPVVLETAWGFSIDEPGLTPIGISSITSGDPVWDGVSTINGTSESAYFTFHYTVPTTGGIVDKVVDAEGHYSDCPSGWEVDPDDENQCRQLVPSGYYEYEDRPTIPAVYDCELTRSIHGMNYDVSEFYIKPTGDDHHCHRIVWDDLTDEEQSNFRGGMHGNSLNYGSNPHQGTWAATYNYHIDENPFAHLVTPGGYGVCPTGYEVDPDNEAQCRKWVDTSAYEYEDRPWVDTTYTCPEGSEEISDTQCRYPDGIHDIYVDYSLNLPVPTPKPYVEPTPVGLTLWVCADNTLCFDQGRDQGCFVYSYTLPIGTDMVTKYCDLGSGQYDAGNMKLLYQGWVTLPTPGTTQCWGQKLDDGCEGDLKLAAVNAEHGWHLTYMWFFPGYGGH